MNHGYHFDAALSEENKREAREMQEKRDARKRVEDAAPALLAACKLGLVSMRAMLTIGVELGASNKNKRKHAKDIKLVEAAIAKSLK